MSKKRQFEVLLRSKRHHLANCASESTHGINIVNSLAAVVGGQTARLAAVALQRVHYAGVVSAGVQGGDALLYAAGTPGAFPGALDGRLSTRETWTSGVVSLQGVAAGGGGMRHLAEASPTVHVLKAVAEGCGREQGGLADAAESGGGQRVAQGLREAAQSAGRRNKKGLPVLQTWRHWRLTFFL